MLETLQTNPISVLARRLALLFATIAAPAVAQESVPFAAVEILNTTGERGKTIADVVLPVAKSKAVVAPLLITDRGALCQVEAMGARWSDGTLRYLRVALPVDVKPHERRTVKLFPFTGKKPVFQPHAAISGLLAKLRMWFRAAGQRVAFGPPVLVDNGSRVQEWRMSARCVNSCMYAQISVLVLHQTPHVRFYFEWGNSNPARKELHEDPGLVSLEVQGSRVLFDEGDSKLHAEYDLAGGGVGYVLHTGGWIADGQAQCFEGRIVAADEAPRVRALAHGWARSGAFGPFGDLIPEIPVDANWWKKKIAADDKAQARQPFAAARHGCHPNPSNAGDQDDFGTIVMRPDVLLADPSRLRSIARSVFQEWCRPTHFREVDLRPVTVRKHPKLLLLSGRPHFPAGPSVDLLGKTPDYLDNKKIAADESGRTFRGHDGQHLSINYLCAFALTTGDRMALREVEHHVEMWLAEFTHSSGTGNDKPGASRTIGRSLMAGCWLWLLTGRDDLRVRIAQRARDVVPLLTKKRSGEPAKLPNVLKPRWDSTRGYNWPPWEESLAAVGLAAVHTLFGVREAGVVAQIVSNNIVRYGVGHAPWGWRVGYKIPFVQKSGLPYSSLADPEFASKQAAGSGLTQWTVPAMILTARYSYDPIGRFMATQMLVDLFSDKRFVQDPRLLEWVALTPRHSR